MLCITMLTSLFSCDMSIFNPSTNTETTPNSKAESDTEEPTDVFVLTVENLSEYRIIIPDKLTTELSEAVKSLQDHISAITGKEPEAVSDYISEDSDIFYESEYEILVGKTNRAASEELYTDIRTNDYGYAMVGKKILIFGNSSETARSSVTAFKADVLNKAKNEKDALLRSGESNLNVGLYTYDPLTVNGISIKNYSIVYPQRATLGEKDISQRLAAWIEINTGYTVKCISDKEEPREYEIQVGNTNRISSEQISKMNSYVTSDEQYYISGNNGIIWATGRNSGAILSAVTGMINLINSNGELNMQSYICANKKAASLSVMSYNIRGMMDSDKRNSEDVIVSIKERDPDIFAPQEATASAAMWISRLDNALSGEYACYKGLCVGKYSQYQPIYYKKDRLELISATSKYLTHTPDRKSRLEGAEYDRIVTIVVLRDKETGVQFVYANNHFDTAGYIVRTEEAKILAKMLEEYPLMPLIVGGDFNTEATTTPIQTLISKSRLKLGEDLADEKTLGGSGASDYQTRGEKIIDIVLVSAESISVNKYEIWDNKTNGKYPSDHLPVCIELVVIN